MQRSIGDLALIGRNENIFKKKSCLVLRQLFSAEGESVSPLYAAELKGILTSLKVVKYTLNP